MVRQFNKKLIYFCALLLISQACNTKAFRIKLTNIVCNVTDSSYALAETCQLKAVSRDLQYFKVYIKILQKPINEFKIRLRFLKKSYGYKPFLYDFTVDCSFIKHLNPLTRIIWGWFKDVSNINHSCPITEDFEVKRLDNRYLEQQLSVLPLYNGDYAFFISYSNSNISRISAQIYVTVF